MTEITIFSLWHLFNQENGTKTFIPFWSWVKRCEFSYRMDAAAGMLVNIPVHILEWGQDIDTGPLMLALGAGGVEER